MTTSFKEFLSEGGVIVGVDVDTQEDFAKEGGKLYVPAPAEVLQNISALARRLNLIIGSVDAHGPDAWEFNTNGGPFPPHCEKGKPGQLKIEETQYDKMRFVPMSEGNVVIGEDVPGGGNRQYGPEEFAAEVIAGVRVMFEKEVYSLFANPNSESFVAELVEALGGKRKVLFAVFGYCTGNYCVDAAAIGLAERGYQTVIVEDATAPLDIGHDGKPQDGAEVTRNLAQRHGVWLASTQGILSNL